MQFKITTIGKIKNKELKLLIDDLKKRISRLEIIELKEVKDKNIEIIKKKECEQISNNMKNSDFNILLVENGQEFDTHKFYDKLKNINQTINFIITGPFGPNDELRKQVDMIMSLSRMTFTHEQAQYMLIEQIYRLECIAKNIPYTK